MDVALRHQKNIARKTLSMSIAGASIMGGMDHREAYRIIFRHDLDERLAELLAEYPNRPDWISWELGTYGWEAPHDLAAALGIAPLTTEAR